MTSKSETNIYKKMRLLAGKSQTAVANALGIKPQTVQKWEYSGKHHPSSAHWKALADLYEVQVDIFLRLSEGQDVDLERIIPPLQNEGSDDLSPLERELIELIRNYGGKKILEGLVEQMRKRAEVPPPSIPTLEG
jgi:transcriptional regulator with XRE-family HTH domain